MVSSLTVWLAATALPLHTPVGGLTSGDIITCEKVDGHMQVGRLVGQSATTFRPYLHTELVLTLNANLPGTATAVCAENPDGSWVLTIRNADHQQIARARRVPIEGDWPAGSLATWSKRRDGGVAHSMTHRDYVINTEPYLADQAVLVVAEDVNDGDWLMAQENVDGLTLEIVPKPRFERTSVSVSCESGRQRTDDVSTVVDLVFEAQRVAVSQQALEDAFNEGLKVAMSNCYDRPMDMTEYAEKQPWLQAIHADDPVKAARVMGALEGLPHPGDWSCRGSMTPEQAFERATGMPPTDVPVDIQPWVRASRVFDRAQ